MGLVAASCTNCGGIIEVDDSKEAGVCKFCGTAFITEKVINNYNTNTVFQTNQVINKTIIGAERKDADNFVTNGNTYLMLGEIENAKKEFLEAIKDTPGDYRGYMGMVVICTNKYTNVDDTTHVQYLDKAKKVADDEQKEIIKKEMEPFLKHREDVFAERQRIREEKIAAAKHAEEAALVKLQEAKDKIQVSNKKQVVGKYIPCCTMTEFLREICPSHNIDRHSSIALLKHSEEYVKDWFCKEVKNVKKLDKKYKEYASNPENIEVISGYLPCVCAKNERTNRSSVRDSFDESELGATHSYGFLYEMEAGNFAVPGNELVFTDATEFSRIVKIARKRASAALGCDYILHVRFLPVYQVACKYEGILYVDYCHNDTLKNLFLGKGNKPKQETSGCYIATSVYGSYDCPQVWTLRRYRDFKLKETGLGRLFIKLYYAISPTVVKIFGKTKLFNAFWKKRLDKKVAKLKQKGFDDTAYND